MFCGTVNIFVGLEIVPRGGSVSVCAAFLPTESLRCEFCAIAKHALCVRRDSFHRRMRRGYKCEPNLLNSHFAFQHRLQMTMGKWECTYVRTTLK